MAVRRTEPPTKVSAKRGSTTKVHGINTSTPEGIVRTLHKTGVARQMDLSAGRTNVSHDSIKKVIAKGPASRVAYDDGVEAARRAGFTRSVSKETSKQRSARLAKEAAEYKLRGIPAKATKTTTSAKKIKK